MAKLSIITTPPLTPIEDDPKRVQREAHSLPHIETWPHRPLMFCVNSAASSSLHVPDHGLSPCPIGVPFSFSSDLFEGKKLIRVIGCKSDDPQGEKYFSGRKRTFQSVVQGRFKEEIPVSDLMTGHEFARPLKNLPNGFIVKMGTSLANKLAPGIELKIHDDQPSISVNLMSASKVVRCDKPGSEPDITCHDIQEDCSLFGGDFSEGKLPSSRRKGIFSNPAKCQDYVFDTSHVYTFEFYEDRFDPSSFSLNLGFTKIPLSDKLNEQPIQRLGKLRDGRYLWAFQLWHEKLLPKDVISKNIANKLSVALEEQTERKSWASPLGDRWAISAPDMDLSGKWKLIITERFKKEYDEFLSSLGQPLLVRKAAVALIGNTREETMQSEDGRLLHIKGVNDNGIWERTLTSSGSDFDMTMKPDPKDGSYDHVKVPIVTADSEHVMAESWWEMDGTVHVSWTYGVKKYGGRAIESRRYLENDNVYVCESTFHPADGKENEESFLKWKFRRERE